ncbi:MAG: serine/threonine-protein kinase, partial [Planctomycetota bacterium]
MLSPDQQQELLDRVVEEFTERLRHGERPAISEYKDEYPELADDIDELLTSVAMIEELKSQSTTQSSSLKKDMKEITKLDQIGDYRIIRELGRGGMGVVFEAVHESLGRRVAIKVMPNRTFDDEKYLERFKREAQAAANLHHTNIVSVFGIGMVEEHHYYVMEFVDGETLSGILAQLNNSTESITEDGVGAETIAMDESSYGGLTNDQFDIRLPHEPPHRRFFNTRRERYRWAARIGLQIADGLTYAHQLGTLHRDVKPSNLLVDKNETVWLTDFGLVKNIGNKSITRTGDIIGTPQYMAPESFEGKYDERSETYCLGLTLYEMVTLQPAFKNASTPELIRKITTSSPIAPRKVDRRIPRDLDRIIRKAISKEVGYRYKKASIMRDDLRAFLEGRPISARKISMTENVYRWSRRNPFAAAMSILTGLMICTIAVGATVALRYTNQALIEARHQSSVAEFQRRLADRKTIEAGSMLKLVVGSYDELFRNIVLKNAQSEKNDISLDGFDDLAGIATTVNETDAEYLDEMLGFYVKFAETKKIFTQLRDLTAKSRRRVANIYHLIGEFDKAIEFYEEAIQTYEEILKEESQNLDLTISLARTMNEKGRALEFESSNRSKAQKEYERSAELIRSHPQYKDVASPEHPTQLELKMQLAKSLLLIGSPPVRYLPNLPERFDDQRNEYSRQNRPQRRNRYRALGNKSSSLVQLRIDQPKA